MKKIFLAIIFASMAFSGFSQEVTFLSDKTFKENVWNYEKNKSFTYEGNMPIIVDFYADWCGPCKKLAPNLEALQVKHGKKIQVYKVNVDNFQNLAGLFGIRSIPTVLFISAEGNLKKTVGYKKKAQLDDLVKNQLGLE